MSHWTVLKQELEDAMDILSVVPTRNAVACSEFIRLEKNGRMAKASLSSDLFAQVGIHGTMPYNFGENIYLDRRLFGPFVAAGKDLSFKEYKFSHNDNGQLVVKHGPRVAVYTKAKKVSGYGVMPLYKHAKTLLVSDDLAEALACAVVCSTSDPITPFLNCVYVQPMDKGMSMYATNGKLVFHTRVHQKDGIKSPIAFPLQLAALCKSIDAKKLTWDESSATLSSETGRVWQAVKVEASKSFPVKPFKKMIDSFSKPICKVSMESLGKAADRLSSCLSSVTREDLILTLKLTAGENKFVLSSGISSTVFREKVNVVSPSKKDRVLEWPLAEVLPVLSYMRQDGEATLYLDDEGRTKLASKHTDLVVAHRESKEK